MGTTEQAGLLKFEGPSGLKCFAAKIHEDLGFTMAVTATTE